MPETKLTFKEQMRGFPVWQMSVICIIRFSEPIAFSSIFPYIYFMIRDFGVAKDKANIATYSGYLAASFAFFQFMFCVRWGTAADRYGRKRILMLGLLGTSVSVLMFGFAPNYYLAIFARSCMGASNGNIAVLRTLIGEVATERKHQAMAFSTLPLLWNVGFVIGPMLGGSKYLTRPRPDGEPPAQPGNSLYERFITKYPYALSNVVVAVFLWSSIITAFLFLEETHRKYKDSRDIGLEIGDYIRSRLGFQVPVRPWQRKQKGHDAVTEQTPLIPAPTSAPSEDVSDDAISVNSEDDSESVESYGPLSRRMSQAIIRRYSTREDRPCISRPNTEENVQNASYSEIFTPAVVQAITANFLNSLHNIVYSEFLPVLLARKLSVDDLKFPLKIKGGFGYELSDIGTLLSTTGFMGTMAIMFIFPYLDRNYKTIHTYRAATSVFPFVYTLLPYLIFTLHEYNPIFPEGQTKIFLYILACINSTCSAVSFPNITMLIHRAAPPDHRSFINGSALSGSSFARFVGPVLWGYLISISEKSGHAQISWMVLAFIAVICSIQAFRMKEHDEDLKQLTTSTARSTTSESTV